MFLIAGPRLSNMWGGCRWEPYPMKGLSRTYKKILVPPWQNFFGTICMQFFNSFYLFSEIRPDSEVLLINITHCDVDYPKCSSSSDPCPLPPLVPPAPYGGDLSPHAKICCGSPEVCVLTIELDKRNKFWDISYFYPWNFDKSENFTAKWNICFQNFTAAIQYIITLEFSTQNMGTGYDIIGRLGGQGGKAEN